MLLLHTYHFHEHHLCKARLMLLVSVTKKGRPIMTDKVLIKPNCLTRDISGRAAVFYVRKATVFGERSQNAT